MPSTSSLLVFRAAKSLRLVADGTLHQVDGLLELDGLVVSGPLELGGAAFQFGLAWLWLGLVGGPLLFISLKLLHEVLPLILIHPSQGPPDRILEFHVRLVGRKIGEIGDSLGIPLLSIDAVGHVCRKRG